VDISYDTQVVEGGVLHLYPDVYKQKTNTIDKVREELQSAGVTNLDDKTLRDMLGRVSMTEEFTVSVADLKSGRLADTGQNLSLTAETPKKRVRAKRNENELRRRHCLKTWVKVN
jgi:hypothetical protein